MSFASKLGKSYEQVKDQAKVKKITIELGEVKFDLKVRIPLKKEMEELLEKISTPSEERVNALYKKLSAGIQAAIEEGGEDFLEAVNSERETIKVSDDDIVVEGTSIRQVARMTAINENQVEEFFHLLQSENGEPITETYEEISSEFPEQVIKEIVSQIDMAIRPDYKTAKKKLRSSLRRQLRTAMLFNGHTAEYIDSLDEETFTELQVMYADGMLGNKGIYDSISPLTTAVFNHIRPSGAPSYRQEQMFPWINEYSTHPDNDFTASDGLLLFMSQAPGFSMERMKHG